MATRDTFIHIKALDGTTRSIPIAKIDDIETLENTYTSANLVEDTAFPAVDSMKAGAIYFSVES